MRGGYRRRISSNDEIGDGRPHVVVMMACLSWEAAGLSDELRGTDIQMRIECCLKWTVDYA